MTVTTERAFLYHILLKPTRDRAQNSYSLLRQIHQIGSRWKTIHWFHMNLSGNQAADPTHDEIDTNEFAYTLLLMAIGVDVIAHVLITALIARLALLLRAVFRNLLYDRNLVAVFLRVTVALLRGSLNALVIAILAFVIVVLLIVIPTFVFHILTIAFIIFAILLILAYLLLTLIRATPPFSSSFGIGLRNGKIFLFRSSLLYGELGS